MSLLTLAAEANSYSNMRNKTDKEQKIKVSNQGWLETLVYICTYCTINHTSHTHTLKLNLLTWPASGYQSMDIYTYALNYQSKVSITRTFLALFHRWSQKCESLASGIDASAIPVSAMVFYSPVLPIGYSGILRLQEAQDSLLSPFGWR